MDHTKYAKQAVCALLASGMLFHTTAISCEAAVITSNATDKTAVIFNEQTAYCAGDYVLYEGELYICTEEVQGAWETAGAAFIQVTKNHELGKSKELAEEYADSKDPSEETSLMAFTANVWQKLKTFFGIGDEAAKTDKEGYQEAPVSAKLNYLEEQNEKMDLDMSDLTKRVKDSFQSVSNGKSLLANTIAGKGGSVSSSATFQQFSTAIQNLAQAQYEAGIKYADGRVNTSSESYKKGLNDGNYQVANIELSLDYYGPKRDAEASEIITSGPGISTNHRNWNYQRSFADHTILGVYASLRTFSNYANGGGYQVAVKTGDTYTVAKEGSGATMGEENIIKVSKDKIVWEAFSFNVIYDTSAKIELTVVYI